MEFTTKDRGYLDRIFKALSERIDINLEDESGVAHCFPEPEDRINAILIISKDDIRTNTGREKLRAPVIDAYQRHLSANCSLEVNRTAEGNLMLRTRTVELKKNLYPSLKDLEAANIKDRQRQEDAEE